MLLGKKIFGIAHVGAKGRRADALNVMKKPPRWIPKASGERVQHRCPRCVTTATWQRKSGGTRQVDFAGSCPACGAFRVRMLLFTAVLNGARSRLLR